MLGGCVEEAVETETDPVFDDVEEVLDGRLPFVAASIQ